jgi:transposase InsO family protein
MFATDKLLEHCERLRLPALGVEYLKRVSASPPSRRVRSTGTNVVCRFPSKKMGAVIQAESHRNELSLVYVLEHYDRDAVAYWDQPEGIKITYTSASGRTTSPTITPDYLVLRNDRVEWVEVKPDDALPELAKKFPYRYVRGEDGKWHSPPAETTASEYGFSYRIWTPSEVSPTLLRNIKMLADYFGADASRVPAEVKGQLKELVQIEQGLSLEDLRQRCGTASADHINLLIVHDELFVDLAAAPLTNPKMVQVYSCREAAETVALLTNGKLGNVSCLKDCGEFSDGSTCLEEGNAATPSRVPDGRLSTEAAQFLRCASPEDLAIANRRYRILMDQEFAKSNPAPKRTVRRWYRLYSSAEDRYGYGMLGLIPRFKDRGNRGPHFGDNLLKLVDRVIDKVYCSPTRPNKRHAYDQLRLECSRTGHLTPSYAWFTKRIAMRSNYSLALSREGKRVAHKFELIRPGEPNDNNGEFPWQVCLTDHTLTDVELVCSETGANLGRAWLSVLADGFSRRILAFVLTFDPPSYRTLMMLMRRCVERHSRLPGCLVVDGGKEFQSVYFENLTAAYGVVVKRRPPGKARFGSVIERLFGTINTAFLHRLRGNTQNTRNVRQLGKSMNPKGHAVYTLEELHDMLSAFAFEFYDNRPHPTLNCSPAEKYAKGIEISGAREHRSITCDEAFHLMTLPTTAKGTAKVQAGMGVKINGFYYWAPEMRSRHFEEKSVRVRYDPENLGVAWAYLGDQWVQCKPNGTMNLEGRTEKEMKLATLEWRRSRQRLGYRQSNSQRDFAEYLQSAEAAKALRLQRAKDRALRRAGSKNGDSEPSPSAEPVDAIGLAIPADVTSPESPQPEPSPSSPTEDYGDF